MCKNDTSKYISVSLFTADLDLDVYFKKRPGCTVGRYRQSPTVDRQTVTCTVQ